MATAGRLRVVNLTRGVELGWTIELAGTMLRRLVGLLGRTHLPDGSGLLLRPCRQIHTLGMRMVVDAVYCGTPDAVGIPVLRVVPALQPWRLGPIVWRCRTVLELPAGTVARTGTRVGDVLELADAG